MVLKEIENLPSGKRGMDREPTLYWKTTITFCNLNEHLRAPTKQLRVDTEISNLSNSLSVAIFSRCYREETAPGILNNLRLHDMYYGGQSGNYPS